MLLINLFGAPSSGKSTGAAYIFAKLKLKNINAELVTEFAKDKVWEESKEVFNNQAYIFGEQYFRVSRCQNKVDVIITDSPLLLSAFYNTNATLGEKFEELVLEVANSYDALNFFLIRDKRYNPNGRLQTEEQSTAISESMLEMLNLNRVVYQVENGNIAGYDSIVDETLKALALRLKSESIMQKEGK